MRINFANTYKEVEQLLKASTKPLAKVDERAFEKSLGDLLLQPADVAEEKSPPLTNSTFSQSMKASMDEVKASFKFHNPTLLAPDLGPVMPEQIEAPPSENEVLSVKTPTLLEVRRVALESGDEVATLRPQTPLDGGSAVSADSPPALVGLVSSNESINSIGPRTPNMTPLMGGLESGSLPSEFPSQLNQREIMSRITEVSQKIGVDPALAMSVAKAESDFNIKAVSSDGHYSKGLFQLLDSTGKDLLAKGDNSDREYDPFDPDLNMELGTSYLRYLHDIFKTPTQLASNRATKSAANEKSLEQLAVAAYNAGEGRVASAQARTEQAGKNPAHYDDVAPFLPRSTREYVARVVRGKRLF